MNPTEPTPHAPEGASEGVVGGLGRASNGGAAPVSKDSLTLVHFGDLHVWRRGMDGDFFPKRFLGRANMALHRGGKFPAEAARRVAERLAGEQADWMLFAGDVSTGALRAEFLAGRALLKPVFERWGDRLIAIPGNHDRYTPRATRDRLFERLFLRRDGDGGNDGDGGSGCMSGSGDDAGVNNPFAVDLNATWTLVGVDCAVPRRVISAGRVTPFLLADLDRLLERQRARGRRLIVMGHYPLAYPASGMASWEHALRPIERQAMLEILRSRGVELYLHGHKHRRCLLRAGGLLHVDCGSAGMAGKDEARRPGYVRIVLDGDPSSAPRVEAHWLADDGQAWRRAPLSLLSPPGASAIA
jgi:predicted phosphodiesterase